MASKVIVTKEQLDRIDNAISTISGVVRARTLPEMAEAILQLAPSSDYVTHEEFEEAMSKLEGLTVYGTAYLGSDQDCNYVSIDANSTDKIIITATNTGDNKTYHLKVTDSGISFILDGETDPVYTLEPNSGIEYTGISPISVDNTDYEISIADATSSASGAMSATDKAKLDALPSAVSGTAPISVSNGTVSIPQASSSSDGYMSSSDKSKLDTLPSSVTGTGAISVTNGVVSVNHATADSDGIISSSDYLKLNSLPSSITGTAPISVNNGVVSISDATTSSSGAMSATDKSKLDSLPSSITGTAPISVTNGVVSIANATMYSSGAMTDIDKFKADTYNVQYMNKLNAFDIGSSDTTRLELSGTGGTGSNKIVVGASNDTDNKKYSLQVNENGVVLHSEDLITHYQEDVFTLTPGGGGGGSVTGQAPIHVNNDVVSISPASQSSEGSMSAADKTRLDTINTCYYGTCMSTADTATKAVTCSGYEFKEGNIIGISFTYGINVDGGVSLNINNTGAKVVYVGNAVSNNTNNPLFADSGSMVYFIAKGSVYEVLSIVTAGAKQQAYGSGTWYGTCNTAAGTSTKAVTSNGFKWTKGSVISVDFSTANTSDVVVLSVNGTYPVVGSAVPVYYNGSLTSSSNKLTWGAGETITFMYMGSDIVSAQDPGHFIVIAKSSSLDATDKAKLDKLSIDSSISGLTIGSDHIEVTNQSLPMSYDIYPATSSSGLATTTDNGYMSASDKSKLDSMPSSITGTTPIDVTNGVVSIPKASVVIGPDQQPSSYTDGYMSGQEVWKLYNLPDSITGTAPISVSSSGAISIDAATTSSAGSMSAADKTKLNSLPSSISGTAPISVSNAGVVSISTATTSAAGSMSASDKTKLNGLPSSITGTAPISVSSAGAVSISAATESAAGSLSSADKTKLDHIDVNGTSVLFDTSWDASTAESTKTIANAAMGMWGNTSGTRIGLKVTTTDGEFRGYFSSTGASLNNVTTDTQQWRLYLGDYTSTHNYGANSKTILGLRNDTTIGDGIGLISYGTDGALDAKVYIGSKKIRVRDETNTVIYDLDGPALQTIAGLGSSNIVASASSPLSISNNNISIQSSTSSRNGYMSSTQASQLAALVPYTPTGWEETVTASYTTATGTSSTTFTNLEIGSKMKIMWGRVQVTSGSSSTSKSTTLTIPGHSFKSGTNYRPAVQVTSMNSALNDVYANAPTISDGSIEIVIGGTIDTASTSSYWVSVCLLCWHA